MQFLPHAIVLGWLLTLAGDFASSAGVRFGASSDMQLTVDFLSRRDFRCFSAICSVHQHTSANVQKVQTQQPTKHVQWKETSIMLQAQYAEGYAWGVCSGARASRN
jgi:hypothetical protein